MLFSRLPLAVMCLVSMSACSKKAKNQTQGEYVAAVLSADAGPAIRTLPTRPDGGFVEGKLAPLDPEEAERRRNKNMVQPIIFGSSVAGITMSTPYSEALDTLVYYGSNQGVDFFQEHIVVAFGAGADPVPFQIGIQEGYAGKLKLPEPYGEVSVGQFMASKITGISGLRQFMLTVGAAFEMQSPASYDCEKSLSCQLNEDASFFMLDFRRGGIYLSKQANLPIGFIYFSQPQRFFATLADPIVHNISIGGLSFQSLRSAAETRLGPTIGEQVEGGLVFSYYDRGNFAVAWGTDNTPMAFKAVGSYEGPLNFGAAIGTRKLGDPFASYAITSDDGTALMLALDRGLNNRAADHDCAAATTPPTCQVVVDTTVIPNRILIVIDRAVYSFTKDENRRFLSVGMREP